MKFIENKSQIVSASYTKKKSWTAEECEKLCKAAGIAYEAGDENRMTQFVASTETADREGDVMRIAGMDAKNFLSNPVFLYVHDYESVPIGAVVELKPEGKTLLATVVFHSVTVEAVELCQLCQKGFLRAVSIGFQGKSGGVRTPTDQERIDMQMRNGGVIFEAWELYEISLCPVGMNPEALQVRALHKKTIDLLNGSKKSTLQNEDIKMDPKDIKEAIEAGVAKAARGVDFSQIANVKAGDKVTAEHVEAIHEAHAQFSKAMNHMGKVVAAHPEVLAPGETGGVWKDEHMESLNHAIKCAGKGIAEAKMVHASHEPENDHDADDQGKSLMAFAKSKPEIFGDSGLSPLEALSKRLTH